MSKIVNTAKTVYYIIAAIATLISAVLMVLFFRKPKIDEIIDTAEDIAETLTDVE